MLLIPLFATAKIYLVSVGIADYPGTENDLALPARDAQAITWVYSKNSGMKYCMLLDRQATRSRIIAAMNKVFAMAGADDIVVFFYSGHGYAGGFCAYDGYLGYEDIRKAMARSRCKNKMIFADACYAGKMRSDVSAIDSGAAQSAARKANVMLFLSSRSDEYSIENPGMANGFFTTYLQKGLRGGADRNKDRIITARELFDYVHRNVVALSNGRQHPVMWGKFADNMPVIMWK